jgi:ketosteroid isomerase-like protein
VPDQPTPQDAEAIARAFAQSWQDLWNCGGAEAVSSLYAAESMLVGQTISSDRQTIQRVLQGLWAQGWTRMTIRVVNARALGEHVLAACEFEAGGTGSREGQTLRGHSSHVLVRSGETWLTALHSAT